jgi:CHASE2 domain-containing sensor protein/predicted Ser/Thr protein kinase
MAFWAVTAATATAINLGVVQDTERWIQSLMFQVRGPVTVPNQVVILAVDDETLMQLTGSSWPLRRSTYAQVIDRVMQAGAKSVAIDVIWDLPSDSKLNRTASVDCTQPGGISEEDRQLAEVLHRYDGRITLGIGFYQVENREGQRVQVALPYCPFRTPKASYGAITFPESKGKPVHQLGSEFFSGFKSRPEQILLREEKILSFAEATLRSAGLKVPDSPGSHIFFYGYAGSFSPQTIPLLKVLSPENWNSDYLQQGRIFKDKIVLIGPTASAVGDILPTAYSEMPGVELHAHAIATLLENRGLRTAFSPEFAGLAVLLLTLGAGVLQLRAKQPLQRLTWSIAIALSWFVVGYATFTQGRIILPIALPSTAIFLSGVTYFLTGFATEQQQKQQFRKTLKRYARSPLVQEMLSQQDDLKDLLQERELEILGKKLGGRYKITKVLGSGGFGETYVAEDIQRPGHPQCVVKQLRPSTNNPKHMQLARRLFQAEAETLEQLGEHECIPRLLAYFEEDAEFYLVQEFIAGNPLSEELALGRHSTESRIVRILTELLEILSFVHNHSVIHRDIKPSNVLKRHATGSLVLIDFGAVKALHNLADDDSPATATIGIGTQGYMPPEQCAGNPRLNSDIYALGMMGIQALTGLPPSQLKEDPETGEAQWQDKAVVSHELAAILSKMVHYDFRQRYQSAIEVLDDLENLTDLPNTSLPLGLLDNFTPAEDEVTTTRPWPETFESEELPPTEPPPTQGNSL